FPTKLMTAKALAKYKPGNAALVKKWAAGEEQYLNTWLQNGRFDHARCRQMLADVKLVAGRSMISIKGGGKQPTGVQALTRRKGAALPVFLRVALPPKAKVGSSWEFSVALRSRKPKNRVAGGCTYRVEVVRKPK